MPEDQQIPKITLDKQIKSVRSGSESILIPKLLNSSPEKLQNFQNVKENSSVKKQPLFKYLKGKPILKILAVVLVLLLIFFLSILIPGLGVYKKAKNVYQSGVVLKAAVESQNISEIKSKLGETKSTLSELQKSYKTLGWTKIIPIVGSYWKDGNHGLVAASSGLEAAEILLDTIEPYADIIGLTVGSTDTASDGAKTAQERIDFLVKTIPDVAPKLQSLSEKASTVSSELSLINSNRYPEKVKGQNVREKIKEVQSLASQGAKLVTDGKPLIEAAPYLLGIESGRTYLVLFQNDKELRPTGGFLTAYSVMTVSDGKFEPVSSNDIYNLDAKYSPEIPAPEPIIKYLKGPYTLNKNLRLRDINWSPDFKVSMKVFTEAAEDAGIKDIDGVIAVDTQLLVNLLNALGPIGVPGFGNYSTQIVPECNCPQVIYELESFADTEGPIVWDPLDPTRIIYAPPNYDNRKKIIGPLMNSILANAMGQPKEKLPDLFEAAFKSLTEKHVLFYLFDEDAQKAVESFGIAGRINDYDGDYLHINDANLGGRKSNLYVTQEVHQEISVAKDGSVEKTVTITYKNPEKHDGWLNSVLPNWVRIYVPTGSELLAFEGVEDKADPYVEYEKTVFAGFFELRPEGVAKVTVKYKLPFKVDGEYKIYLQKQPGTDAPLYVVNIGKQASGPVGPTARREEEFFLRGDKELKYSL